MDVGAEVDLIAFRRSRYPGCDSPARPTITEVGPSARSTLLESALTAIGCLSERRRSARTAGA